MADRDMLQASLLRGGDALWQSAGDGSTALHYCAERDRGDLAAMLLDAHPAPAALIAATRAGGATPLHVAAVRGASEVVTVLLSRGITPRCAGRRPRCRRDVSNCRWEDRSRPHRVQLRPQDRPQGRPPRPPAAQVCHRAGIEGAPRRPPDVVAVQRARSVHVV
eukprot:TRINITY_DN6370_c0_g1_i6.p1 TRINITY_DN6370_c0_g1~~TRINITY_DN6370_c0_g1_i6.p1  ORF type:complete len:164 (+),score=3.47 TRINITY_DN6370_c0_g1_i6:291-782(+)